MDLREKVSQYISKASNIFSNCYKTFDEKIAFLRNTVNDINYPFNCENKKEIEEAIFLLGENAKEAEPRKYQQSYLAELVKKIMSNPSKDDLLSYFKENELLFDVFCLMYVHFNQETVSEKEKNAHAFMNESIKNCAKLVIE